MRLLEPVGVTVFEGLVPSLQLGCSRRTSELVAGSLLLEILLSHHVQLSVRRQRCSRRRLLSDFLPDCISRPLLRNSAVSRAMSAKRRHTTYDKRRHPYHHKKPHGFKFSDHDSALENHMPFLLTTFYGKSRPRIGKPHPSCHVRNQATFYSSKGPTLAKRIDLFDSTYSHFTKQVLETVRKESSVRTLVRTVGRQSRNTIASFRGLIFDLSITFSKLLAVPADLHVISPITRAAESPASTLMKQEWLRLLRLRLTQIRLIG